MAQGVSTGFVANGNIGYSLFVKQDSSVGKVVIAGAGEATVGISGQSQRNAPWYPLQDGYAAVAGENVRVYTENEVCYLRLGGTVTNGQRIKSDASGKGVAATADKDAYGAKALQSGVDGDVIEVVVETGFLAA